MDDRCEYVLRNFSKRKEKSDKKKKTFEDSMRFVICDLWETSALSYRASYQYMFIQTAQPWLMIKFSTL